MAGTIGQPNQDDGVTHGTVTSMLRRLESGDRSALDAVVSLVYEELRGIAAARMSGEPGDHTLQPTALVHEAILRLARREHPSWESRDHFIRSAATVMRSLLIDHARTSKRLKRGGDARRLPLDDLVGAFEERAGDLVTLDEALQKLATINPRHTWLIELRFFGGASLKEAAGALGISERTAKGDWALARRWLWRALYDESA